jgi:hypothetical protein
MIQTDNVQKGILLDPEFPHFMTLNAAGVVGPVFDYFAAPQRCPLSGGGFIKKIATYDLRHPTALPNLKDVCGHQWYLVLLNDAAIYDAAEADPAKFALWHMPTLSASEWSEYFLQRSG